MALVLSRKTREEIVITTETGKQIVIGVAEIRNDKVRLAIDAPKELPVHRREVFDEIQRNNEQNAPTHFPRAA